MKQEILGRVRGGALIREICGEPGMPRAATVALWGRRDAWFKAALAEAVRERDWRRRFLFRTTVAEAYLVRLRDGGRVQATCGEAGMPSYAAVRYWRRSQPEFGAEVNRIVEVARVERLARLNRGRLTGPRPRGQVRAFDQAAADAVIVAVSRGATLAQAAARPGAPDGATLRRWRAADADFDTGLAIAQRFAGKIRMEAKAMAWAPVICERLLTGASLNSLAGAKDLPGRMTIWRWMRRYPAFRAQILQACGDRDDWLLDQVDMALEAGLELRMAGARAADARALVTPWTRQRARLRHRPGRRRGADGRYLAED